MHYYDKGFKPCLSTTPWRGLQPHTEAEAAVKELQKSEFDMPTLSIVGKDSHTVEHVIGYYNAGDRMQFWEQTGGLVGRVVGPAVRLGLL